jgi:hypothetical protein
LATSKIPLLDAGLFVLKVTTTKTIVDNIVAVLLRMFSFRLDNPGRRRTLNLVNVANVISHKLIHQQIFRGISKKYEGIKMDQQLPPNCRLP